MNNRGGAGAQVVFSPPFPLIGARNPNAPKPLIRMAALEAVYFFRVLLVFTEGRFVNRIFRAVRKPLQRIANGTRFVRCGGFSGNRWQSMFRLPADGDFSGAWRSYETHTGICCRSQISIGRDRWFVLRKAYSKKTAKLRLAKVVLCRVNEYRNGNVGAKPTASNNFSGAPA